MSPFALSMSVFLSVILVRLFTLAFYPLMDTTEARYGEMARIMVETGNWLTPMFDYNVPFWGKPPLHTWMSASSIAIFGNNEFFMRLPHWLAGLASIGLTAMFAKRIQINTLNSAIVLASVAVFSVSAGAVMTDMALALGLTMAFAGFYLAWDGPNKWAYLGFIGLSIGMLAKGPVTIVIFALGAGLWLFWEYGFIKCWRELARRIPLVKGFTLLLLTSAPWFILAERATPGFLEYFFVGEHWLRFVESGWAGDLYGSAHDNPRGKIWLDFIGAALPWTLFIPQIIYRSYKELGWQFDSQTRFLLCWMLSPMILFTFAGNIQPAYVLPAAPALALLLAKTRKEADQKVLLSVAMIIPALLLISLLFIVPSKADYRADKRLLSDRDQELPTYYLYTDSFSSRYYSNGTVKTVKSPNDVEQSTAYYLVLPKDRKLDTMFTQNCEQVSFTKRRAMYLCQASQTNS
ncbi:glycosyltransferase family 39 protein [Alginatibacterium sediminis]|uniref:Glycosyltransferase family 39 protein n=2 Tax=Alginatibacterium sediminis TaxID=2164068 RepID=A0A420EIG4_9ALTE|nr:glycosyltransferase family 39 protein [Alginatibacterium sediminis]